MEQTATGAAGVARLGEVIEASTTEFTAQAYVLHDAPPFGSFVRASDGEVDVLAVVANARTGSVDPGRRPIARGYEEADEDEVYRRNPELREILRTEFVAVVVGYREVDGSYAQRLPRRPPRLHAFVYACPPAEIVEFTARLDFLSSLVGSASRVPVDELVAACVREANVARGSDHSFLVAAGKELATLFAGDINRLSATLRRIGR